jgi:hypothetical protein
MKETLSRWFSDLSAWFCWNAWNYARKRALARKEWHPHEAKDAAGDATPDQRRIRANEARQMLENAHFRDAWDALASGLEARALSCDTYTDEGQRQAARIVAAKQILHGLRREFVRKLDDGYMAEVELDEIARKRRLRVFER